MPYASEQNRQVQAVTYLRVSESSESTKVAIERQREAFMQYASELGLHVMREYVEVGSAARSIDERPVLGELLDDLDWLNDAKYVIVYEHKSIALTTKVYNSICERIEQANARLDVATARPTSEFGAGELIGFLVSKDSRTAERRADHDKW
jgi:hypothetical protein